MFVQMLLQDKYRPGVYCVTGLNIIQVMSLILRVIVSVLPAAQIWTHKDPQNFNGEGKLPIIFTPAEDRTRAPLQENPNLYRAGIKAGLYSKAVQVCVIYVTTIQTQ